MAGEEATFDGDSLDVEPEDGAGTPGGTGLAQTALGEDLFDPEADAPEGDEPNAGDEFVEGQEEPEKEGDAKPKRPVDDEGKENEEEEKETEEPKKGEEDEKEGEAEPKKGEEEEEPKDQGDEEVDIVTKVDGKEETQTVKMRDLVRSYQKSQAANLRFEEAKRVRDFHTNAMQYMLQSPAKAYKQIVAHQIMKHGYSEDIALREAEMRWKEHVDHDARQALELASMSPEERKRHELNREIQHLEERKAREEKARREEEINARVQSMRERRTRDIRRALYDLKGRFEQANLPVDTELARRVDSLWLDYQERGVEFTAQDAAEEILREREAFVDRYLQTLSVEDIRRKFPDIDPQRLRRSVDEAKQKEAESLEADSVPQGRKRQAKTPRKRVYRDFLEIEEENRREFGHGRRF